ncbi:MAG: hypothetical protein ACJ8G2_03180 [Burkholderiales bacterium]|jgi:hypothetical protein
MLITSSLGPVASAGVLLLGLVCVQARAEHSFEFVAEHLPEAAMDNRFATLPLWNGGATPVAPWQFTVQGGWARTGSGGLTLDGPMLSAAVHRQLDDRWTLIAFGFFDDMRFSGASDQRPLETLVAHTPLVLPAETLFTNLQGTYRNAGAGIAFNMHKVDGWLGERQWVMGALYQRVQLQDYRANYRVLEGPSSGATGFVDYSAEYPHLTPFAGLALVRHFGSWSLTPHALFAIPVPRRGFQGRINGPGFDVSGDTETAGAGKHFGDISLTFGLDVGYKPWGLTLDIGTFVSQALLEPIAHKGIDQNWVISAYKQF